jgi:biotin carboxyl carrier protein
MEESFTLTLDGIEYKVEVSGNTFTVDGHPFVVGFEDEGRVSVDGIAYDIVLDGSTAVVEGIAHQISVGGLDAQRQGAGKTSQATPIADEGSVHAIMPGSIVRVLVEVGDEVTAGQVLLVLEAMKMENELRAPISGIVGSVHVDPGQAVEMNTILAEIAPLD